MNGRYLRSDASLLNNIALYHLRRGQIKQAPEEFQIALEWYQQALPLIHENRDLETEVSALTGKAESHLMLRGQPDVALKVIDQAVAIAERSARKSPARNIASCRSNGWRGFIK